MDIFNRKKVKEFEKIIQDLQDNNQDNLAQLTVCRNELHKFRNKSKELEDSLGNAYTNITNLTKKVNNYNEQLMQTIEELNTIKSKLTIATRLNEIYEAKPKTEDLEKAIKKNEKTITYHLEREKAFIKRIDELEKIIEPAATKTKDVPIEDYNYGGKIPTRNPKTGRFMKS